MTLMAGAATAAAIGIAHAEPAVRGGTVPASNFPSQPPMIGDLWTFKCPKGGAVSILVDTIEDNNDDVATLDPLLQLIDGAGVNLLGSQAFADDEATCSVPPTCGFACPEVVDIPCGDKNPHSILIANNAGVGPDFGSSCIGGGYVLTVEVKDKKGAPLAAKKAKLGGGNKRKLPKWADPGKVNKEGPALDNEIVPFDF